jgi:hypothetical protein
MPGLTDSTSGSLRINREVSAEIRKRRIRIIEMYLEGILCVLT